MEKVIGIDIGGTNIKGVIVNELGEVLMEKNIPTQDDNQGNWRYNVIELAHHLKKQAGSMLPIGISAPGFANAKNSAIAHLPNRLFGLENFIWEDFIKSPTFVLNDAHAALMAEAHFGSLKGMKHALLLTLGTGVGGGILINGELYQGIRQIAGHLGHTPINIANDEQSIFGLPGSLEYEIGNYSVKKRSSGKFESVKEVVAAYEAGDLFAQWFWLDTVRKLSIAIAGFINTFSPEAIALSGGITLANETLFTPLTAFLDTYEFKPHQKATPILKATFGEYAGAMGAAAFARSKTKNS